MRSTQNTSLIVLFLSVCALCVCACKSESTSEPNTSESEELIASRRAFIEHVGDHIIFPRYQAFEAAAAALRDATAAYATSLSATDLAAARAAWEAANDLWQQAEVFLVGPAGLMGQVAAGEDLRDQIYSWPIVNRCRVDQEIVEKAYEDTAAFAAEAVNVRGLAALEYLLFYEGTENACAPQSVINAQGQWAAIPVAEFPARRARYAQTLGVDLLARATTLRAAWDSTGQNFLSEWKLAGQGSATYPTAQEALNALSDAVFYIEADLKDMKIGRPAGIIDCTTATCPEALEGGPAKRSRLNALQNLQTFQDIFLGDTARVPTAGPGFDDLLRAVGADALADAMTADVATALALLEALPADFSELLTPEQLPKLVEVHTALRALSTRLKTEFISVLDLELPQRAEGDND